MTDKQDAIIYSDYNLYGAAASAWQVEARKVPISALRPTHERYSQIGVGIKVPATGPFGKEAGPYRPPEELALHVTAPVVHAVSDTTVDIEWRTSLATDCTLLWRVKGGAENAKWTSENRPLPLRAYGFTSYSLWGLLPDTEYEFQVKLDEPAQLAGGAGEVKELLLVFRTAAAPRAPIAWYVATNGNDTAAGQSREQALRTVSAASARARAGDTVWVAGGTYTELVHVRSTGTEQRPLTFRSLPGEKVVFDGNARALAHAFMLTGKAHIHLDGFYFKGFGFGVRRSADRYASVTSGVMNLYITKDVRITRCFADGRGQGYSPALVGATYSPRLLIRNCATAAGSGPSLRFCEHARFENNVFFQSLIQQYQVVGGEFSTVHNIIIDNPANKVLACLLEIPHLDQMEEKENCYFLRVPDQERKMFLASGLRLSLADYQEKYGDKGSFIADPQFQGMVGKKSEYYAGLPAFPPDILINTKGLDFPDMFATNPKLVKLGIGLQPEAFKDFHFNRAE
jgi:hypothetical protein